MPSVLCDTSIVSVWRRLGEDRPQLVSIPNSATRASSTTCISVVTVAEMRFGYRNANWGERRLRRTERWLDQFVRFEIDEPIADTWAELKAAGQRKGWTFGVNDLWIAATGRALDFPVLTCDRAFVRLGELGVEVVHMTEEEVAEQLSAPASP